MTKIAIKRKFHIIHTMYRDCNHSYKPTRAQKLFKMLSYAQTYILLHVLAIHSQPNGDISTKEYVILIHKLDYYIYNYCYTFLTLYM
jgi:hypothetical protein